MALPWGMGFLIKLRELDISYNKLSNLPDSICKLTDLKRLILSCNKLSSLPSSLSLLTQLEDLYLWGNCSPLVLSGGNLEDLASSLLRLGDPSKAFLKAPVIQAPHMIQAPHKRKLGDEVPPPSDSWDEEPVPKVPRNDNK
jgi:Leucine rich repeat